MLIKSYIFVWTVSEFKELYAHKKILNKCYF